MGVAEEAKSDVAVGVPGVPVLVLVNKGLGVEEAGIIEVAEPAGVSVPALVAVRTAVLVRVGVLVTVSLTFLVLVGFGVNFVA